VRRSARGTSKLKATATVFAALGDRTRLRLAARLSDGARLSITKLTTGSAMTRQAVTKHLRVMEHAGLVRSSRQGRENIWRLEGGRLKEARRYLDLIMAR
jgi:DNA-binding transcriptional ArsR family regulator